MKKLGFGLMRLPLLDENDPTSFDEAQICRMADAYLQAGFTYFDTAYMYHNGKSEEMLKKALTERYPREAFQVADKLPTFFLKQQEDLPRIFQEQLDRTGLQYFDCYLLHCLDQENYEIAQRLRAFDFVMQKKAEGKVRHIGFSFHDSAALLDEILTAHPETEFVQLQINYLDWDSESVQSRLCYETAVRHGKEIVVMEPVKGGTLANVPQLAEALLREKEPEMSVPSWAIRFAASLPGVVRVLSGMSNEAQLLDNIGYMRDFRPLTEAETALCLRVRDIINHEIAVPCTGCSYCTEGCPMQIPIPVYFRLYNQKLTQAEYEAAAESGGSAADCLACGQCEQHCPQHLPIIHLLRRVAAKYDSD